MTHGNLKQYKQIASLMTPIIFNTRDELIKVDIDKMIYADTCFSGGLRKEKKGNDATSSVRNGDVMFFLSSRTNETSQEMIGGPNGQFTRFLVRGLGGEADTNRDKIITAKELYDFVHKGVSLATGNKQHPVMWGRFNNSMPVINWNIK